MSSVAQELGITSLGNSGSLGFWRAILAGPGQDLGEVFAHLERTAQIDRVVRHPKRGLLGARVTLTPAEGDGYWKFTRIRDDFSVVVWNFAYKNPRFELVPGDGLIQFKFKVTGDLTLAVSGDKSLRFNRPSLLVWTQSLGVDIPEWTAPSTHERMVVISVRPDFLVEHLITSITDAPLQLQAYLSHPSGRLNYCHLPLTAQMFELATKLINNPLNGALDLVYTEALALEILCAAVGGFRALPDSRKEEYTERELRSLQEARSCLMRQFAPPPTIRKLARLVGMAESALTKGFKAVYSETIFDFSLRSRMQRALVLLRDQHWSVDKVSHAVGYSHSTSFATAFRRHFGVRPIDVKRVKSSVGVISSPEFNRNVYTGNA